MSSARWFSSARFDLGFFHLPIWLTWLCLFLLPASLLNLDEPLWVWLFVVVLVDVGHVWASLYRTYLDPVTRKAWPKTLLLTPILVFFSCLLLAIHGNDTFWRVLSYVAAYHFVKQQLGITALYNARYFQRLTKTGAAVSFKAVLIFWDKAAIYAGTLGPLIWWHCHLPRQFNWFIEGDFINLSHLWGQWPPLLTQTLSLVFYMGWMGTLLFWLVLNFYYAHKHQQPLPFGKMLWVGGTAVNWYLGLVFFDSSLAFTVTNVIAHGIPYYGLIGLHQNRTRFTSPKRPAPQILLLRMLLLLIPIWVLSLSEEYLWDFFLYRENAAFFHSLIPYWREALSNPIWRAIAMAMLSLPQVVHYVLDGFIWKMDGSNPDLKQALFPSP